MTTITARLDLSCPADPTHEVRCGDQLAYVPGIGFCCGPCSKTNQPVGPTSPPSIDNAVPATPSFAG